MTKNQALENDLLEATKRFEEVLAMPFSEVIRDSAIKRFELCFDLAWKSAKEKLRGENIECFSPKSCFSEALRAKMLPVELEQDTNRLLEDRNLSVHTYDSDTADEIYKRLPTYVKVFKALAK
ncbi:MAG: HI0074 family nucleotidyltransferase substrate-binding subunit [Patescibacteria group bacterium]